MNLVSIRIFKYKIWCIASKQFTHQRHLMNVIKVDILWFRFNFYWLKYCYEVPRNSVVLVMIHASYSGMQELVQLLLWRFSSTFVDFSVLILYQITNWGDTIWNIGISSLRSHLYEIKLYWTWKHMTWMILPPCARNFCSGVGRGTVWNTIKDVCHCYYIFLDNIVLKSWFWCEYSSLTKFFLLVLHSR